MAITIEALQKEMSDALGYVAVEFDDKRGLFRCHCGNCGGIEVRGDMVQHLHEKDQMARLSAIHEKRCVSMLGFKKPSKEVLDWLKEEAKVDIRDVYRFKLLRCHPDGSGAAMIWLFCRNKEGQRYIGSDKQPARRSVTMICQVMPKFLDGEYGQPMTAFDDEKALPVVEGTI